jgi:hypothetical protein
MYRGCPKKTRKTHDRDYSQTLSIRCAHARPSSSIHQPLGRNCRNDESLVYGEARLLIRGVQRGPSRSWAERKTRAPHFVLTATMLLSASHRFPQRILLNATRSYASEHAPNRMGAHDKFNAFVYQTPESTQRNNAVRTLSVGVKDNICTNDLPTTCSSTILKGVSVYTRSCQRTYSGRYRVSLSVRRYSCIGSSKGRRRYRRQDQL